MYQVLIAVEALWCAAANRMRGGWLGLGEGQTQLTRLRFGAMIALAVLPFNHDWRLALATIPAVWLGATIKHGAWMGARNWKQDAMLGLTGIGNVLPLVLLWWAWQHFGLSVQKWEYSALIPFGLMKPLAYMLGSWIPSRVVSFRTGPELGETIFGVFWGLGIAAAFS